MVRFSIRSAAAAAAALMSSNVNGAAASPEDKSRSLPALAQTVDQRTFNVLAIVPPAQEFNGSSAPWTPPNTTAAGLLAKPFHVYDVEFLDIIGPNPTFSLLATTPKDPIFHESPVWYKANDEVFFLQNAGAPDAGTGLNKSAAIYKISLKEADAVKDQRNATGKVKVTLVPSKPEIPNPNGATQYKGKILFAAEGQGNTTAPGLFVMSPVEPYTTTVLLNNYFGRQFNSLNDLTIHPKNLNIYFTDPSYGDSNNFRPPPGMPKQVYRFDDVTGAVTVVADGFFMPNGIAFTADGKYAYVSDTGMYRHGLELENPSSIYRFDVQPDGTFENRKTFAYIDTNIPDGVHTDSKGNVYSAVGDGVHIWNPSGKLIGKIYTGRSCANFQFVGGGRMLIMGETQLYYVNIKAEGHYVESYL